MTEVLSSSFMSIFTQLAKDGNGKVSVDELQLWLHGVGEEPVDPKEMEELFSSVDKDGDGLVGLDDLAELLEAGEGVEEDVRAAFGVYEMEGVGQITAVSLRRTLSRLGNSRTLEECRAMIGVFDMDGDGMLSLEEFKLMMGNS